MRVALAAAVARASPSVYQDHQILLASFGGISQPSNAPEHTRVVSDDSVLTESEAQHDGSLVQDFAWAFDAAGVRIPYRSPKVLLHRAGAPNYDVSRDGQQFLMVERSDEFPTRIHLVVNWSAELEKLAPMED